MHYALSYFQQSSYTITKLKNIWNHWTENEVNFRKIHGRQTIYITIYGHLASNIKKWKSYNRFSENWINHLLTSQGTRVHIQHSEDCCVCCQNADQEIFQHESFSYNIHTAIRLCPHESCAVPDPWTYHCWDEAYTYSKSHTALAPQTASNTTRRNIHGHAYHSISRTHQTKIIFF